MNTTDKDIKEDIKQDLTISQVQVDRQNILNNPYALQEIEKATRITGIPFEGKNVVLKEQVADFFEVSLRTVENYLSQYGKKYRCQALTLTKLSLKKGSKSLIN